MQISFLRGYCRFSSSCTTPAVRLLLVNGAAPLEKERKREKETKKKKRTKIEKENGRHKERERKSKWWGGGATCSAKIYVFAI